MNIPLDRLYHYIRDIAQEIYSDRIIIYRFWPHGSKNINDLTNLNEDNNESLGDNEWTKKTISPAIWCNDQEPLDHEFYKITRRNRNNNIFNKFFQPSKNLNYRRNIFEKNLLLHSEKRSHNLKKYLLDGELIPVYYWSHAVIARDWFRYAEHERFQKSTKKTFLIYSRAWSGTREYRLKFADLLIKNDLVEQCQTSCNPIEPELEIHYTDYQFKNPQWKPTNRLENFLQPTTADATSSADFNTDDYNSTDIEVVLETLFDDSRLQLTEKSLRPIACGQPFILTGTVSLPQRYFETKSS
jgi:phage terminase large subunit-like protein